MIRYPKNLKIANTRVSSVLNNIKDVIFSDKELLEKAATLEISESAKYKCSDEYLFSLLNSDKTAKELATDEDYMFPGSGNSINLISYNSQKINQEIEKLRNFFKNSRLTLKTFYPSGSGLAWHHNGNKPCPDYRLLFSYSATGEGRFRYYDYEKNKIIDMKDIPEEWTAKTMFFPKSIYSEQIYSKKLFWHTAETACNRISIGLGFLDHYDHEFAIDFLTKDS